MNAADTIGQDTPSFRFSSVDVSIAIAGAMGGIALGLVVAAAGYPLLAVGSGTLAPAIVPSAVALYVSGGGHWVICARSATPE